MNNSTYYMLRSIFRSGLYSVGEINNDGNINDCFGRGVNGISIVFKI